MTTDRMDPLQNGLAMLFKKKNKTSVENNIAVVGVTKALLIGIIHCKYRVSLKKGTFLIFCLISVLEVGFYFFTCVLESEF